MRLLRTPESMSVAQAEMTLTPRPAAAATGESKADDTAQVICGPSVGMQVIGRCK